ncbi:MAG: flavodoxin family protein [Lentisphaerae bacterium]|nr:flavodoxin family protein [Lentisphaerota bacterium]MBT4822622.1 flavodoxin family protein [Lentisphaerota bacterium]MBT5607932.1 flavodoxin family protein [Lentisphaerota bacterium]MBT7056548.1 flavodoxin family protein [Lentisphaerota bacterium]MBT7846339.1 flavodoxin family protein [Lentisphaerota bacterium]
MKVLGIAGSPRLGETTEKLVSAVLSGCECETELISLCGDDIRPCKACLACVKTNVCIIKDDMAKLRDKIVEADAYVVGAANYYSVLNGLAHCFLERFYQFRHRDCKAVAGKLGVAVGVGGGTFEPVIENIRTFFQYNQIECIGSVGAQGAASCFTCGYGETCTVGAIHKFFGPGTKITEDMIPCLDKQQDTIDDARALGKALSDRLKRFAESA